MGYRPITKGRVLQHSTRNVEEDKGTKWVCMSEACGHEWFESPFVTCGDCPKCENEYVEHY